MIIHHGGVIGRHLLRLDKKTHQQSIIIDEYYLRDRVILCSSAKKSLEVVNAGGKSQVSEALSIDYFVKYYHACDIVFEMEVEYWSCYSMVDYLCTIKQQRVGVSVTRAMGYPDEKMFDEQSASYLLKKKLYGLIVSRNATSERHSFYRSVLHVWCQSQRIAQLVQEAFSALDLDDFGLDIKGTVILVLSICSFAGIYNNSQEGLD
jgi:hypothetical protein